MHFAGDVLQAIDELRGRSDGWWAVALTPLITQAREFHILHRLKSFPVSPCSALTEVSSIWQALCLPAKWPHSLSTSVPDLECNPPSREGCPPKLYSGVQLHINAWLMESTLQPDCLKGCKKGAGYSGLRSCEQLRVPVQLVESILQPERLKACEKSLEPEAIRRLWPREVAEKSFIDYLWSQYDYTQLGAIEVHMSHSTI